MSERSRIVETALAKLRSDKEIADFTIASSSGKEWKVHKFVLFMYSDVLYRMSTSKEFMECQNGRMVLQDIQDRSVGALIDYMYSADVDLSYLQVNLEDMLPLYIELWRLADMYNVKGMQQDVLHQCKQWAFDGPYVDAMCAAVPTVQGKDDVPGEITNMVVGEWANILRAGLMYDDPCGMEKIESVLDDYPMFAAEVLKEVARSIMGNRWP
ncbi:hypothetical protein M409DRAFT_25471 [Zasmidium cellare ATCC 36951]|uniref:BTB domain-containing protein n=1 Tax=Zasmidium cellare ATCC 36951 TaxID=1080233 RepID=A0A6A6CAS6_ZASCE|nr:uncharacterized protein M409DRAFT_25471 [Zasmidium cellare ATCC 36951]KAF2164125.1 hypothetical protein M409DRAFT_25471 [Zasmidium cellare ATCC 36951]